MLARRARAGKLARVSSFGPHGTSQGTLMSIMIIACKGGARGRCYVKDQLIGVDQGRCRFLSFIAEESYTMSFLSCLTFGLVLSSTALALNVPRQASNASGYSVKTPPLDTEWTYEVGTNPWPEYPRPLLERSQWQSLNGVWRHQNVSSLDAVNSPPVGQVLPEAVLVPSCLESGLSGTEIDEIDILHRRS